MIAIDADILSLIINPEASVPRDFRTNLEIPEVGRRIDALLELVEREASFVLIPAPALAEVLVPLAPNLDQHLLQLNESPHFRIKPFGVRAATEFAVRTKTAIRAGDKKAGLAGDWKKIKFDRQILAIACVEGAVAICSADEGVHKQAAQFGISPMHLGDIKLSPIQTGLFGAAFNE
jgi:hypothetical protein